MVVTRNGLVIGQDELNRSGKSAIIGSKPITVPYKYFDKIKANKIIYDATDAIIVYEVLKYNNTGTLYLPCVREQISRGTTEGLHSDHIRAADTASEVNKYERVEMTPGYKLLALITNRVVAYTMQPILDAVIRWDFKDTNRITALRVIDNTHGFVKNLKYYTIEISTRGYIQADELAKFSDMLFEKDMILVSFNFEANKIKVASRANNRWDDFEKLVKVIKTMG